MKKNPVKIVTGIHNECDIIGNRCSILKDGYTPVGRLEMWIIDLIELSTTLRQQNACLSIFRSNLHFFINYASSQFNVISVEPQLDLCCALSKSTEQFNNVKAVTLCGGVTLDSSSHEMNSNGGYRLE